MEKSAIDKLKEYLSYLESNFETESKSPQFNSELWINFINGVKAAIRVLEEK